MKHLLSLGVIFATLIATVFVSCRQGDKGEPGPSGTSGQLLPYSSSGSITGTISGTTQLSDEDFTKNVNFKYYKGPTDNAISTYDSDGEYYMYSIARYDSVGGSYIKFEFRLEYYDEDEDGTDEAHIYDADVAISYAQKAATNDAFYFGTCYDPYNNPFNVVVVSLTEQSSNNNSNVTFDHISVNSTTGLVTFDYSIELDSYYNSTGNEASVEGTVSVTPYNVSYRQGTAQ